MSTKPEVPTNPGGDTPEHEKHPDSSETLYAEGVNPWAVCTSSVGRENKDKFERCVLDVKAKHGIPMKMSEEEFLTEVGKTMKNGEESKAHESKESSAKEALEHAHDMLDMHHGHMKKVAKMDHEFQKMSDDAWHKHSQKRALMTESMDMAEADHAHNASMRDSSFKHNMAKADLDHEHRKKLMARVAKHKKNFPEHAMPASVESYMAYKEHADDESNFLVYDESLKVWKIKSRAEGNATSIRLTKNSEKGLMKCGELNDVEIFATGTHRGRKVVEADLDRVIANWRKFGGEIESPMVLGHDEDQKIVQNSGLPALGWTKSVSKHTKPDGEVALVASFSDVPDVVKEAIKNKRYKRISAELYTDYKGEGLTLRRVALLGADVPEVKTLADVVALDEVPVESLFYAESEGEPMTDAEKKAMEERLQKLQEENSKLATGLEAATKAAEDAKKEASANAEKLALSERQKKQAAIATFTEGLLKGGKILPKWRDMGLDKFLESLNDAKVEKFAEGKPEVTPFEFVKKILSDMPDVVQLSELAKTDAVKEALAKGAATSGVKNAGLDQAARQMVAEKAKIGEKLDYAEAVRMVAKAQPELAE